MKVKTKYRQVEGVRRERVRPRRRKGLNAAERFNLVIFSFWSPGLGNSVVTETTS